MGTKIGSLTELAETPAVGDKVPIVDISTGITKYVTYTNLVGTSLLITMFEGCFMRPQFGYDGTDTITIGAGWYEHNGTAQQMLNWSSELTYQFGSGGSNANSDDLGASEWHYLYIDDSELSGTTMVVGEFVNTTTAPSWSEAKNGWYNGNDRCIGAFLTNSSSNLEQFLHDGGDLVIFKSSIDDRSETTISTTKNITVTVPAFCSKILFTIRLLYNSANTSIYWTEYGGSSQSHFIARCYSTATDQTSQIIVPVDSTPGFTIVASNSGASIRGYTDGFYLPRGM